MDVVVESSYVAEYPPTAPATPSRKQLPATPKDRNTSAGHIVLGSMALPSWSSTVVRKAERAPNPPMPTTMKRTYARTSQMPGPPPTMMGGR